MKNRKEIQQGNWIIDVVRNIHEDYKDVHAEAVQTKTMIEDEVVTRYRILLHEKDGTTSFMGDGSKPFEYPNMTLAERDLQTFKRWQKGDL